MSRRSRWIVAIAGLVVGTLLALVFWTLRNPIAALAMRRRAELRSAGFAEVDLAGPDGALHAFVGGSGPGVLLLHGTGDQAGTWASVAPKLAERFRVVAVDLPGHGESAPAEGALAMATVVAGAERFLDEAAADGPAIVVGNSLGAWLATLLADRHPGRVARAVLVDGGALLGLGRGTPSLQPKSREEAAVLMGWLRDPSSPEVPGWVLDDAVRRAATGPIARMSGDAAGIGAHLLDEARLATIRVPFDLLWGASDRLVPVAYAERMAAALPAARITLVERCGHVPQLECPERFLAKLEEVLDAAPPALPEPAVEPDDETPEEDPA